MSPFLCACWAASSTVVSPSVRAGRSPFEGRLVRGPCSRSVQRNGPFQSSSLASCVGLHPEVAAPVLGALSHVGQPAASVDWSETDTVIGDDDGEIVGASVQAQ